MIPGVHESSARASFSRRNTKRGWRVTAIPFFVTATCWRSHLLQLTWFLVIGRRTTFTQSDLQSIRSFSTNAASSRNYRTRTPTTWRFPRSRPSRKLPFGTPSRAICAIGMKKRAPRTAGTRPRGDYTTSRAQSQPPLPSGATQHPARPSVRARRGRPRDPHGSSYRLVAGHARGARHDGHSSALTETDGGGTARRTLPRPAYPTRVRRGALMRCRRGDTLQLQVQLTQVRGVTPHKVQT